MLGLKDSNLLFQYINSFYIFQTIIIESNYY
jgi:hypothetical protein